MAKKSEQLEQELAALQSRIATQKAREREAGERELLKLVRRGDCLQAALAWAKSRASTGRRTAHTDMEAGHDDAD